MERKNSIYRVLYYECPVAWDFSLTYACPIWYLCAVSLLRRFIFLFALFRLFWV